MESMYRYPVRSQLSLPIGFAAIILVGACVSLLAYYIPRFLERRRQPAVEEKGEYTLDDATEEYDDGVVAEEEEPGAFPRPPSSQMLPNQEKRNRVDDERYLPAPASAGPGASIGMQVGEAAFVAHETALPQVNDRKTGHGQTSQGGFLDPMTEDALNARAPPTQQQLFVAMSQRCN